MTELHNTMMGRKLFESDIPKIAKALERIADALEKQNDNDVLATRIKEHEEKCMGEWREQFGIK